MLPRPSLFLAVAVAVALAGCASWTPQKKADYTEQVKNNAINLGKCAAEPVAGAISGAVTNGIAEIIRAASPSALPHAAEIVPAPMTPAGPFAPAPAWAAPPPDWAKITTTYAPQAGACALMFLAGLIPQAEAIAPAPPAGVGVATGALTVAPSRPLRGVALIRMRAKLCPEGRCDDAKTRAAWVLIQLEAAGIVDLPDEEPAPAPQAPSGAPGTAPPAPPAPPSGEG